MQNIEAVFWCSKSKAVIGRTPMAALPFAGRPAIGSLRSSGKRSRLAGDAKWGRQRRGQSGGPIAAVEEIRGAGHPGFKPGAIECTKTAELDLTQYGARRSALFIFLSLPNCPQRKLRR